MERRIRKFAPMCVALALVSSVFAGDNSRNGRNRSATARADTPIEAPRPWLRLAPGTDPSLGPLLTRWVRASESIRSLEARVDRIRYDDVFQCESRTEGSFVFLADGWSLDLKPITAAVGSPGSRTSDDGEQYTLKHEAAETHVRMPKSVWLINHDRRECEVFNATPVTAAKPDQVEQRGVWYDLAQALAAGLGEWYRSPPPFFRGATAEDVRERYRFELISEDGREIRLRATPAHPVNYHEVSIILDRKSFQTRAVQLIAPIGTEETVFVFKGVTVNGSRKCLESLIPDVSGYRITRHR